MTRTRALYALAVAVLMGTLAVAALADDQGMNMYEPSDGSISAEQEKNAAQAELGEIREPVETGAVPDQQQDTSFLHANDEPEIEAAGGQTYRPDTDLGP